MHQDRPRNVPARALVQAATHSNWRIRVVSVGGDFVSESTFRFLGALIQCWVPAVWAPYVPQSESNLASTHRQLNSTQTRAGPWFQHAPLSRKMVGKRVDGDGGRCYACRTLRYDFRKGGCVSQKPESTSHRVSTTGDVEVSTYLEIAEENLGQTTAPSEAPKGGDEAVVVLDFGSQFSRLITRRVREAHVYCEIYPHDVPEEKLAHLNIKGFILSGGPASVFETGAPQLPAYVLASGVPVLGICYGMQLLAHSLGGAVEESEQREYGHAVVHQNTSEHPLFEGLPASMPVWMSHGDKVTSMPPGFQLPGLLGELAGGHDGQRRGHHRPAISPGGRPHALRRAAHPELPPRRLRLRRALDARQLHRGKRVTHTGAGRPRTRHLRPLRRRRLRHHRRAHQPRRRRAAHLHLRRQRPAAPRGGGARRQHLQTVHDTEPHPRRCHRPVPGCVGRCHGPGAEAPQHRRNLHPCLRRRGGRDRGRSLPGPGHSLP